ncbi:MAG: 4Fe-4S dicluster domain-containing protein, partial [Ardenticatenaceae bacterium]
LLSPGTAQRLGLETEALVELDYRGRTVRAPIWVQPGHADESVTVLLGYGRRVGRIAENVGFDAYSIRTSEAPWFDGGLEIRATGDRYPLATVQGHYRLSGRDIVRTTTLQAFREEPSFEEEHETAEEGGIPSLYPEYEYDGYAWGMAIDLTACVGCNACVVACQAENNIPIVGKTDVLRHREMHWLRVDTYYMGDPSNPSASHMPVPCMHCEKAPCELVCPVAATLHGSEGLNEMVYNRCVGTRYCSNNCPYKVRRFNFLDYIDEDVTVLHLLRNPDVTVRSRGVMEKCTYCVQRINAARIEADKGGRAIRDGEILTACQAACPTKAIVFGNINDPEAEVTALKAEPLNYALLGELGTQPRTTYLAGVRNPNPEIDVER